MNHFIQNTATENLSQVINDILPAKAQSMDFLVGFFYFSGMEEIYKNIEGKQLRILVGLDLEHDFLHKTSEIDFYATNMHSASKQELREQFYKGLTNLFNTTNYFESDRQLEAFKVYYDMVKKGLLEIRKTLEPCHAKMYIFDYKDEISEHGKDPGTVITGSSNLTHNGLVRNQEINVRLTSKPEYDEAKMIFNELWNDAVVIVDKDHINDFEDNVIKHTWYEQLPSPYLLYLRVLYEYFHIDSSAPVLTPSQVTNNRFDDLQYQLDAVRLGLKNLKEHNGVIVADVVGLGKSIIGATIARNLNLKTIIVCPPHLKQQWEDYSFEFCVNAKVFSRGNMDAVLEYYQQEHQKDEQWLIMIDEAHYYRNEYIKDYGMLHEICQNNKVLLLTATPFNNKPEDIYTMIKLFQVPSRSTLQTVSNLGKEFSALIAAYRKLKKEQKEKTRTADEIKKSITLIGEQIRYIINPIVIRRSRLDLQKIPTYKEDLERQHYEFPKVNPPRLKDYDLDDLAPLYIYTLSKISPKDSDEQLLEELEDVQPNTKINTGEPTFNAVRYQPALFVNKSDPQCVEELKKIVEDAGIEYNLFIGSQRNISSFMRTLLVHRFESSQCAFRITLDQMLANYKNIQAWIEKRKAVPVFKKGMLPDIEELYASSDDTMDSMNAIEETIERLQAKGMFEIPMDILDQNRYKDALETDVNILKDLKKRWDEVPTTNDPKLKAFAVLLKEQLENDPNRKIVVFSMYADTANYLGESLKKKKLPVFTYTSKVASRANKEIIRKNFDAGLDTSNQADDYKILVATDAISEGYNLHRAGIIFNYDIPYNPTRVIQRVGRINRVNKKVFDELFIYNYFPTAIGETETRTKEISTLKMDMIHAIMGEDTRILTKEEQLNNYFEKQYQQLVAESESESWDTEYRAFLQSVEHSEDMKSALALPLRSKIRRLASDEDRKDGVMLFAKKGSDFVFCHIDGAENMEKWTPERAFKVLKAEKGESSYALNNRFNTLYGKLYDSLKTTDAELNESETSKRKALDKIRLLISERSLDAEYLQNLKSAVEHDVIAGYYLREISKISKKDSHKLMEIVTKQYVNAALMHYNSVGGSPESVILAEEIQNITTNPQTEIEL